MHYFQTCLPCKFIICKILNILMGVSRSKTVAEQLSINQFDWEYLSSENGVQVVKHHQTNLLGQVALIVSDPLYLVEDQLDIYNYRKDTNLALVCVYGAQYLNSTQATMCGNQHNIKVIHERIPYRYNDLPFLSLQQAIYALSESLRGFEECYQKVGSFELTDRMIGINNNGNIKVWLNQNFAENHPSVERPSLQITVSAAHKTSAIKEQECFVKNLIEIIRCKLQEKKFPAELQKLIKDTCGFQQTYSCLQRYCNENKLWIPDRIIIGNLTSLRINTTESTIEKKRQNIISTSRVTNKPKYQNMNAASQRSKYVPYPFQQDNVYPSHLIKDNTIYKSNELPNQGRTNKMMINSNVNPIRFQDSIHGSGVSFRPI